MGLYAAGDRLYMSTRYQLWYFDNLLGIGEKYGECDRLYVPRTAYTTGDLNAHEVVLDDTGKVIFVNTDFSCLATLSPDYNFVPLWQPPFISKLVPEDRCHLNGVAMVEGKPKYVTACSATDTAAGWRNCRADGGVAIDIESNEIIVHGLSMPHSPRWYQGKLWLVNSGTGELGYIEGDRFVPVNAVTTGTVGNGSDNIIGGTGNDTLDGGNGNDNVFGGAGNDNIIGANGNDILKAVSFQPSAVSQMLIAES